jgi:hypothetical protein
MGGGEERTRWQGRASFILACIGSAVGLGNVWYDPPLNCISFPHNCHTTWSSFEAY